jgi:hypothetical protein
VPARRYLLITDAAAPLVHGEAPAAVMGLARAFTAGGATATVLALGSPEATAQIPGLARRLRTIPARVGNETLELTLYEGRAPLSQAQLLVAGTVGRHRGEAAALLAAAVRALGEDGLLKSDVAIAWGETAAPALAVASAPVRIFVVPSGRLGGLLSEAEVEALGGATYGDGFGGRSLAAIGAAAANAIIAPSPSAARVLEQDQGIASRASDEPVVAVRFGCDDPPHDPASDAALAAPFSARSPGGKLECRRAVTRRHSLALGPRTLLVGSAPLRHEKGGGALLGVLEALASQDVAVLIPGEGDADLLDRARRLAIQSPGRLAVLEGQDPPTGTPGGDERLLRAAAEAMLCADPDDRTARAAGLAQRYGALPIALDVGAPHDVLVDFDAASATGTALLYDALDAHHLEGAIRRAVALRGAADAWPALVQRLMDTAPRWAQTAAAFEEIAEAYF